MSITVSNQKRTVWYMQSRNGRTVCEVMGETIIGPDVKTVWSKACEVLKAKGVLK